MTFFVCLWISNRRSDNSIFREKLYTILRDFNIHHKLIRIIKATMQDMTGYVRIGGRLSDLFKITKELKQGDGLAPMLFNLVLEYVVRKTQIDTSSTIMNKSIQLVGYADDIDILGRSISLIKEAFLNLKEKAEEVGLMVNAEKTKIMLQSRRQRNRLGANHGGSAQSRGNRGVLILRFNINTG